MPSKVTMLAMVVCFLAMANARGQSNTSGPGAAGKPPGVGASVKFNLTPREAPVPALKYLLLPNLRDLKPGNAALFYQRAHSPEFLMASVRHPDWGKVNHFLEIPLQELSAKKVETVLIRNALREIDRAARSEQCNWELLQRLREDGITLMIPDVQFFRTYGNLLALRARLEIKDGNLDQSLFTLQTGFGLSRHLGEAPLLIGGLVAKSIADQMLNQMEEFIRQPGSPNLYWALADLPRPFLDGRKALQSEMLMGDHLFPLARKAVDDAKAPAPSLAQIQKELDQLGQIIPDLGNDRFGRAYLAARSYPLARRWLLAQGRPEKEVDAIPVTVAWVMYSLALKDQWYQDLVKWSNVPYWKARPHLQKICQNHREDLGRQREVTFLAQMFMPAVENYLHARVLIDRRIAALQTVEALRLHAAASDGQLPRTLEAIEVVPVPPDPVTGQVFQYRLENGRAVLSGPPPAGLTPDQNNSFRFEITIRGS